GISSFRAPARTNARIVLVTMAAVLGFLVAGVSWLAHLTRAAPRVSGYPSVISQEARAVFGHGAVGTVLFVVVQAASALILYTGANTSFNGFPYLASFVAGDSFLPRRLTKRGHRLVFSNGIIVLAVTSVALLLLTGAKVNALVPFYAIGVFTGFTMAGFGMAKYHRTQRESGWRRKLVVNTTAGAMSLLVVAIFAIVKFTEGAWLVVVLFPLLVVALIRLNRRYREEEAALAVLAPSFDTNPGHERHTVLLLVGDLDVATLRGLRYARDMTPDRLRAVHFVLDDDHSARLATRWETVEHGAVELELLPCPDRRLRHAAVQLTAEAATEPDTDVTIVLPRRAYGPLGRLLHDHTADHLAAAISGVPNAAATIVPFDVERAVKRLVRAHHGGESFLDTRRRRTGSSR
ncbi:amino acid permease, partial [Nocardia sp. NPDC004722]